jgi:hypothetical protein
MSGERRLDRQENGEPSLAMSFVVLFVVLLQWSPSSPI